MWNRCVRPIVLAFTACLAVAVTTAVPVTAQPVPAPGSTLPTVVVLATGGTIAGAAASDVQAAYIHQRLQQCNGWQAKSWRFAEADLSPQDGTTVWLKLRGGK